MLVYGTEAILPVEVALGSTRVHMVDQDPLGLELERCLNLDMVEGVRCRAMLWSMFYQQPLRCHASRSVRSRALQVGDLVLRRIQNLSGLHKLSSWWDSPFTIVMEDRMGAYQLAQPDGQVLPNSWNADQL